VAPGENADRYPEGDQPSEEYFDLEDPVGRGSPSEDVPDMNLDLDEDVDFTPLDGESTDGMSDEAIDRLLPPRRSSSLMPQFLRRALRR
jgi:hypothetical protein